MHVHKMTSLYYFLCHMQSADQCTVDDSMISLDCYSLLHSIIALAFDHCVGSVAIFMAMEHHRIKEEARQTHSMEVHEDVYHKSVQDNHHTKHAKFEQKCN